MINRLSNARNVFLLALRGLKTLDEQSQPLYYIERLWSEARELAFCVQSLERQVAVHSCRITSGRADITPFQKSVRVAQSKLADARSA